MGVELGLVCSLGIQLQVLGQAIGWGNLPLWSWQSDNHSDVLQAAACPQPLLQSHCSWALLSMQGELRVLLHSAIHLGAQITL